MLTLLKYLLITYQVFISLGEKYEFYFIHVITEIVFYLTLVIQVGLSAITYEVTESPNKEVSICVNIELGSLSSDATLRLLTPPSGTSTGIIIYLL